MVVNTAVVVNTNHGSANFEKHTAVVVNTNHGSANFEKYGAIAGFVGGKFELGPSFSITLLKNFFSRGALRRCAPLISSRFEQPSFGLETLHVT